MKDEWSENLQDTSGFLILQRRQVVVAVLRPDVQPTEGIALCNGRCILYQSVLIGGVVSQHVVHHFYLMENKRNE